MARKEKRLAKEELVEQTYNIKEEDLENKDLESLEKTFDLIYNEYNRQIDSVKHFDNKASLLLVIFVGLFTIFSCFIQPWQFCNGIHKKIFFIGFGITTVSYLISFILFILTIIGRGFCYSTPKMIAIKFSKKYEEWLKTQILTFSSHICENLKPANSKAKVYMAGCITLIVSVLFTFVLASFLIYCNVGFLQ